MTITDKQEVLDFDYFKCAKKGKWLPKDVWKKQYKEHKRDLFWRRVSNGERTFIIRLKLLCIKIFGVRL